MMTGNEKMDAKKRIMEAAARLFAEKSYGTVGVREIAKEANVNISMISYYFNGKVGILKAIVKSYLERFFAMFSESVDEKATLRDNVKNFFRNFIDLVRSDIDTAVVWFSELPNNIPEIVELKAESMSKSREMVNKLLAQLDLEFEEDRDLLSLIAPLIINMVFSYFITGPIIDSADKRDFDDNFADNYSDVLSTFCLQGIEGVVNAYKNRV